MNKSNIDFMIKDFLKQNCNIDQFTKIVSDYKEKGLINEEIEKVFYEFLFNKAKHCPEFLRKGDLLELLLWYTGDNDPKVLFRLFKAAVNLSLGTCYDNFPMGMERYIISVLNPEKFLDINNERFALFNLTLIDSKFNEFVELVINLMMNVDVETKENLLMDWSIFGTRSYLEKFRDPDFILRFFGVIEDESYKLHMETLHNTISNIFLNENQQFEFIQRCRTQNNYEKNISKIANVGKKFEKFFYSEPVTSAVLEIVLKFSGEKERKPSDVSIKDEMRYGRYINCALYCLDTWEKRTEKMSAKMLNSARKRIIIEALKLIYEDDSSEWFGYLEKLIDKELDEKYRDDEGKDHIPYYATESTTVEIPDYEDIDNTELALEAYSKTSGKIAKAERGIYRPFKKFKIQADKVDSEANKVLKILKKMVAGDKHTEIIEGKKYTPITLVTRALGTIVLFKFNKVAAILAVLVGFALDKKTEAKERVKIVADLETELTMLNEKIEDARSAGDNEAKYAMMRTKAEIEKTIKKIKYGIEAGTKSGVVTNDYMNYGEK